MTEQLYSPLPDGYMRLLKLKHDEVRSGRVLECELVIQASPTAVNNEDTVDNVGAVLSRTGSYKHDNIDKGFNPLSAMPPIFSPSIAMVTGSKSGGTFMTP